MRLRALVCAVSLGVKMNAQGAPLPAAAYQPGLSTPESGASAHPLYAGSPVPGDPAFNRFDLNAVSSGDLPDKPVNDGEQNAIAAMILPIPLPPTPWLLVAGIALFGMLGRPQQRECHG